MTSDIRESVMEFAKNLAEGFKALRVMMYWLALLIALFR